MPKPRKMKHRYLEIRLWLLAVGIAATTLGVLKLHGYPLHSFAVIFLFLILPSSPFVLLALRCRHRKASGTPKYPIGCLVGATVGAIISTVPPCVFLWCDVMGFFSYGGANIGLGLVFVAMPLYLPLAMIIGWCIGSSFGKTDEHAGKTET